VGGNSELKISGDFRVGDNRHSVSCVDKLRALGWSPTRKLSQIMSDFLDWVDRLGELPADIPDAEQLMRDRGIVQGSGTVVSV
jgi:dTDP-L-rhamnose 4-epimerase